MMFGKPLQTPAATGTSGGKNLFSTPTPANKTGGGGGNGFFGSTPSAPTNATNTTSGLFANAGNTGGAKSDNNNNNNNNNNITTTTTTTTITPATTNTATNNINNNTNISLTGNTANTAKRAQGNNYNEIVKPREVLQHLFNFQSSDVAQNKEIINNLFRGQNSYLMDRIVKLKERITLSQQSVMQHMFYRIALADPTGVTAFPNECHSEYRAWFFNFLRPNLYQNVPGAKTSNHPEFYQNIRPNLWNEAQSVEKIEGVPVLPDPIQGLEQLRDYIRLRSGSITRFDARLVNASGGANNGLGGSRGGANRKKNGIFNKSSHRINVANLLENVKILLNTLATLKTSCNKFTDRSNNIRNRHWKLRHRLVKVIGLVKMLHNWAGPTTNEDIILRERLNHLANRIVEPGSFRAKLQDLEMELKITHNVGSKKRAPVLNNMDMARLYEFLEKQHSGLAELTNVLKKDARDIGIIVNSMNQ